MITENPILFVLTCVGLFLLVVMLMGIILLMTTKKKGTKHSGNTKLNRESLMIVSQHKTDDDGGLVRGEEVDGVSNLAFDNNDDENRVGAVGGAGVGGKKSKPIIHFPLPPRSRPSSTTSR